MVGYLALFLWPVVALLLFQRLSAAAALCWTVIGGFLLLPQGIGYNLPMLPLMNKVLIPSAAAFAILLVRGPSGAPQLPGWLPRNTLALLALLVLTAGVFLTVLTNEAPLFYGTRGLRGLQLYDAFSDLQATMVALLPFVLGRRYLAHPEGHRVLLLTLCLAALAYTLPTLYEWRMSPQLSRIIYGVFPHNWRQHVRDGGFRPVVFLPHALWLAAFLCSGILAALASWRIATSKQTRTRLLIAAVWLLMTLILTKSLGALIVSVLLAPVVMFVRPRMQLLLAGAVAAMVLTYPTLRGAGLVPTDKIISVIDRIDVGRAASLEFRFENEDLLLAKANQRPLFGWGGSGRSRVFNDKGEDIGVTDGQWVIRIGESGWLGYLGTFGLLCGGILLLTLRRRQYEIGAATTGLCLVMAANLIDLIPNSSLSPVTWLIAGALLGRVELGRVAEGAAPAASALRSTGPALSAYTRQTRPHHRETLLKKTT